MAALPNGNHGQLAAGKSKEIRRFRKYDSIPGHMIEIPPTHVPKCTDTSTCV
jgi:hypothetical protein